MQTIIVADTEKSFVFVDNGYVGVLGKGYQAGNPYIIYGQGIIDLCKFHPHLCHLSKYDLKIVVSKVTSGSL